MSATNRKKELSLIEKSINAKTSDNIAKVAHCQADIYANAAGKMGLSFEKFLNMCTFNLAQLPEDEFRETVRCLIREISTSSSTLQTSMVEKRSRFSRGKARLASL